MILPAGLQLYTVRDETDKDFVGTLEKVAEIGYQGVEFAGFGGLDAKELKKHLDRLGIRAVSSHIQLKQILNNLNSAIEYNLTIGSQAIVCPYSTFDSRDEWLLLIEQFEKAGEACRTYGLDFCYHNHAHEFVQFDGKYALDILYQSTKPEHVKAEIDTCFVKMAGLDPAEYIMKYTERCPLLHLKDYEPGTSKGTVEVGSGVLDIPGIVEAGNKAGVQWIIVEQETFQRPSLESARISFDYLQASCKRTS